MAAAHDAYERQVAPSYDEVPVEVAAHVSKPEASAKPDIGALLLWKRIRADTRWTRQLLSMPDVEVRTPWIARGVDLALSWLGGTR